MRHFCGLAMLVLAVSCTWQTSDDVSFDFVDESKQRGIDFVYLSGETPAHRLPEILGGGAALLDSDQDGDLDIYFVQSGSLDEQRADQTNVLLVNDGDGNFIVSEAGDASRNLGYGMGVAVGDFDNDSMPDLFVTQFGRNVLLRNQGENQFLDVTEAAGFRFEEWSTATAWADFDLDGDLDLWVVNYIDWSESMEPECYQKMLGSRDYCSPTHYNAPAQDRVYRNDGDGKFTDVTLPAGVQGTRGNGLGIVSVDFNHDGLLDVFVANDTSPNNLWLNRGDFQFEDVAPIWNCALDSHGVARAGMGIVATDLDDDRDQDVMVVHITTEPNYVFRNERQFFRDVASQVGLGIYSQRYTRFGLVVDDLNNDGWLDIFEANGAVSRLSKPHKGDRFAEPNVFYVGTPEGRFQLVGSNDGIHASRAAAVGDLNNDGQLEIVVVDRDHHAKVLVNQENPSGNWLMLDLRDEWGRPAIGAIVSVDIGSRTLTRVVQRASSYLSSRDWRVHFGLGENDGVSNVSIRWLNGKERQIDWLDAGQIVTLKEGQT